MASVQPSKESVIRLTPHQRLVLEGLSQGGMLIQDKHNCLHLGAMLVQPITRQFLVENHLIERLDKTRGVGVIGNGFIITKKGCALLSVGPKANPNGNPYESNKIT